MENIKDYLLSLRFVNNTICSLTCTLRSFKYPYKYQYVR